MTTAWEWGLCGRVPGWAGLDKGLEGRGCERFSSFIPSRKSLQMAEAVNQS